jgi:DNA-binding CsgD family transcriptional regulator
MMESDGGDWSIGHGLAADTAIARDYPLEFDRLGGGVTGWPRSGECAHKSSNRISETKLAALSALFNQLTAALFLVDRAGRIVCANASGRRLLAAADVVQDRRRHLAAIDAMADRRLREAFRRAGEQVGNSGGAAVLLPAARSEEAWVAHVATLYVSTLECRNPLDAESDPPFVSVIVRKAAFDHASALATVAKTYNLTRAEARVLAATIGIGRVSDVARAVGISATTAKTHLLRIFDKTGTHRQADLVKLVAGFVNPFA